MFERFTDRARRVVVLAQDEARLFKHNYISSEHLLLALLAEGESLAWQAMDSVGMTLADARTDVEAKIGLGESENLGGHIPFTPSAKKVLEQGMRRALLQGVSYIGAEHLLLGLIEQDSDLFADADGLRDEVLSRLGAAPAPTEAAIQIVSDGTPGRTRVTVDGKTLPVTRIEWVLDARDGGELILHVADADVDIAALNARFVGPEDES